MTGPADAFGSTIERATRRGSRPPVVFVGDSITDLWAFHRASTFEAYGLRARGYSGWTARAIAARLPADLAATRAGTAHVLCGVNDLAGNDGRCADPETVVETIAGMLDAVRSAGATAVVGSLLPAARIPWNAAVRDVAARITAVNALLRALASDRGAIFVDYHGVLADGAGGLQDRYGTDGLHPNAVGYATIEPLMLGELGLVA